MFIKQSEVDNPLSNSRIEIGRLLIGELYDDHFVEPTVGNRFYFNNYGGSTSGVQEIINENTFRTYNSIYKWKVLSKEEILKLLNG